MQRCSQALLSQLAARCEQILSGSDRFTTPSQAAASVMLLQLLEASVCAGDAVDKMPISMLHCILSSSKIRRAGLDS